tara:strand:- start:9304 stop:10911 length:1608 start_codon:yes stop_codon:yes gene_type:complete
MAETVSYGSYTFPSPPPLVGESSDMVYVAGEVDNFANTVEIVGTLTGENLSGLHLQKMDMITGLLPEFQTLSITNDAETKEFTQARPVDLSFSSSDLTTVLPYAVSFACYSSGTFSKFFGVEDPTDNWEFVEQNGKITEATHRVSAKGVKIDANSPLVNARHFVTGRMTGFSNLSLFQTGRNNVYAFLTSRTEDINKVSNSYELVEQYSYSTSENPISNSGVVTTNTSIGYTKEGGLNVRVNGSIFGSMDANITGGLLNTGNFTTSQAKEVAVNAVVSSLSDYESGLYSFADRGPTSYDYSLNTGENRMDFSFVFADPDNDNQIGNVLHTRTASISASKDQSFITVAVNGEFTYNAPFDVMGTGDPATGVRFQEVEAQFSGIAVGSGFLNLAVEALRDFREDATGWHISGDYLNPTPKTREINKRPYDSAVSYNVSFTNEIDLSSGLLSGLKVNIQDTKPIELSGIVPSLAGYAQQKIYNRTLGQYSVSANCDGNTGTLETLEEVVSGYLTGIFDISKAETSSDAAISLNWSRYY